MGDVQHTFSVVLNGPRTSPTFYLGWSFRSYLSLGDERSYASGITAYHNASRVTGFAQSGSGPSQYIGYGGGNPIHLALRPGERLVSAWFWTSASYSVMMRDPTALLVSDYISPSSSLL